MSVRPCGGGVQHEKICYVVGRCRGQTTIDTPDCAAKKDQRFFGHLVLRRVTLRWTSEKKESHSRTYDTL